MKLPALPVLPVDKANHIVYGLLLFALMSGLLMLTPIYRVAQTVAWLSVLAIALCKEWWDHLLNLDLAEEGQPPAHGVETLDVLATVAGALMGWLCTQLPAWCEVLRATL